MRAHRITQAYRLDTIHGRSASREYGFTLVETLIAILVISASLSVILPIMARLMFVTDDTQQQLTAINIAQQGIELLRMKRDNNLLCLPYPTCSITEWTDGILASGGGTAHWLPDSTDITAIADGDTFDAYAGTFSTFSSPAPPVLCISTSSNINEGRYTHNCGAGTPLPGNFRRVVRVEPITGSTYSVAVTSKVTWGTHGESIELQTVLYNTL